MRMDSRPPFFRPGGTLEPEAESYITREADEELLNALLLGEYVFLLDSRQKGKSSLVARTLLKLKDHGVSTVKLDLQRIGANVTPEQWYAGLLSGIGQELSISAELFAFWEANQSLGPLARWLAAIEKVVLSLREGPIVIFIDEVDFVRTLPFSTDELFAGIRECFNRRAVESNFRRLTFCLVGVATPGQLIRNPEITPFNIGTRINLSDFTLDETLSYQEALGDAGRDGKQLLTRVHYWVAGHPYLTQVVCSHIAKDSSINSASAVDNLVSTLFFSTDARQRDANLSDVERRLLEPDVLDLSPEERRVQVLDLYGRMLRHKNVSASEENPIVDTLRLSGVGADASGCLGIRNRVYRKVFDEEWRRSNLPDAEVRRLRSAAKRAVIYTGLISSVVLLAVSATALGMWRLSADRKSALDTLGDRTKELDRVSNERQRSLLTLQERSRDLKQASDEKQRSLDALETKTEELNRVSNERLRSLADLKKRSAELAIVSGERQDAIVGLQQRERDLTYSNYLGQIGRAQQSILMGRWTSLPELVQATEKSPHRSWEWGNLALAVHFGAREEKFPKWTVLEARDGEDPGVFAPNGIYDIDKTPARKVYSFKGRQTVIPRFREGNFRVKVVEGTRGDAIFDAKTDRLLVKNKIYTEIMDIDPKRRLYLLARDWTLETVELRTIDDDRLVVAYTGPAYVHAAQFLPDGSVLSVHESPTPNVGEIRHWDSNGRTISSAPSDQQFADGITVSRDGSLYAAWGFNKRIEIRSVDGHKAVTVLPEFPMLMSDVKFSGDGRQVLVGCYDGYVYLHDLRSGEQLAKFAGHRSRIHSVAFLKSNKGYAGVDSGGLLKVWTSVPEPGWKAYLEPGFNVKDAVIGADGKTLLTTMDDKQLLARDLDTGNVLRRTALEPENISVSTLTEGSDDLFIGRDDGQIERIALNEQSSTSTRVFATKPIIAQVVAQGKGVFVGTEDRKFALLDAQSLRVIKRIEPAALREPEEWTGVDITDSFAYDQETPQFAMFLGTVGKIQVYSAVDGSLLAQWNPGRAVRCMTFVNGGKQLVASLGSAWWVRDGQTILFDVKTGKRIYEFKHLGQTLRELKYAPRTGVLAGNTGDYDFIDRVVYLWDLRTRKRIGEVGRAAVSTFFFSPDGERVITHTGNNNISRLWDSRTSEEMFRLTEAGYAKFSADGRRILQFPPDGSVRVWNSASWK
jgi:WD40 repeat protein